MNRASLNYEAKTFYLRHGDIAILNAAYPRSGGKEKGQGKGQGGVNKWIRETIAKHCDELIRDKGIKIKVKDSRMKNRQWIVKRASEKRKALAQKKRIRSANTLKAVIADPHL